MKKYLYLLMVAVFATLPFALTSCGDDDDEDTPSLSSGNFTVDGIKMTIDSDEDATYAKQSGYKLEILAFTDYMNGSYMASISITMDNSEYGYKLESGDVLYDNGKIASKANILGNTEYAWMWIMYNDYETEEGMFDSWMDTSSTPMNIDFLSGKITVVKYDEEAGVVSIKFDKLVAKNAAETITHTFDGTITAKIKK